MEKVQKPLWRIKGELIKGDGPRIADGDVVTIEFTATLPSGKEIANTYKRGLSYTVRADRKGDFLSAAVFGMRETGEREVAVRLRDAGIPGIVPGDERIVVWIKIDGFSSPVGNAVHLDPVAGKTELEQTGASG